MTRSTPARHLTLSLALLLLTSCALWELGTPVRRKPLRPCVGTYVYPDSASVCAPKEER